MERRLSHGPASDLRLYLYRSGVPFAPARVIAASLTGLWIASPCRGWALLETVDVCLLPGSGSREPGRRFSTLVARRSRAGIGLSVTRDDDHGRAALAVLRARLGQPVSRPVGCPSAERQRVPWGRAVRSGKNAVHVPALPLVIEKDPVQTAPFMPGDKVIPLDRLAPPQGFDALRPQDQL